MVDNQTILNVFRQSHDQELNVIEMRIRPATLAFAFVKDRDERSVSHGLRFNNPDPIGLSRNDRQDDDRNLHNRSASTTGSWPRIGEMASGSPTKEFEAATKRFFAVIGNMEQLKREIGFKKWADVPKNLHNITAVAKYLYMKPAISDLFDSVIDVQTIVESCWNSL